MRRAQGKTHLSRLATIEMRSAELQSELAQLTSEKAKILRVLSGEGEVIDLSTGRRIARAHTPELPEVSEAERALARAALQRGERRRRLKP
jgi:hypothetical protein